MPGSASSEGASRFQNSDEAGPCLPTLEKRKAQALARLKALFESTPDMTSLLDLPSGPKEPLSVQIEQAGTGDDFVRRLGGDGEPFSLERVRLSWFAERFALQREGFSLMCGVEQLPEVSSGLLRRFYREQGGRGCLFHEPGFPVMLELGAAMLEGLLRGLFQRVLMFVPKQTLGFWRVGLEEDFGLVFSECADIQEIQSALNLFPHEVLEGCVPGDLSHWVAEGMAVFVDEGASQMARATMLEKLGGVEARCLMVQSFLPFGLDVLELYPFLSAMRLEGLPGLEALGAQIGGDEAVVTPELRQVLRPWLAPVVLRHVGEKVPKSELSWKSRMCKASAALIALREEVEFWVQERLESGAVAREQESLLLLLRAVGCSAIAVSELIERWISEGVWREVGWEGELARLEGLSKQALEADGSDSRYRSLVQWLKQTSTSRIMVFCHHESTRRRIEEVLAAEGLLVDGMVQRLFVASDVRIPVTGGELDTVLFFDFPWEPLLWESRAHWMRLSAEKERGVRLLMLEGSPETKLFELALFRWKLETLQVGEAALLNGRLPEDVRFPQAYLQCLEHPEIFWESLSLGFLEARKLVRQQCDLNRRLFLEDYAL